MKPYRVLGRNCLQAFTFSILAYCLLYAPLVLAKTTPSAGTMLDNFTQSVPQLMRLVTACAYVMGMWFVYQGVVKLKDFGEQRSAGGGSSDHLKNATLLMVVGTLLLYLPSSVQVGLSSFWAAPNPYGYKTMVTDEWDQVIQDSYLIIQLIGTISFIRGLVVLSTLSGQAQPGTFGRGLTFVIAGTLCINLFDFIHAIESTLDTQGFASFNNLP